jgi:hypothetical protein
MLRPLMLWRRIAAFCAGAGEGAGAAGAGAEGAAGNGGALGLPGAGGRGGFSLAFSAGMSASASHSACPSFQKNVSS